MHKLLRPGYRRADLQPVISPNGIATVGASPTPKLLGSQTAIQIWISEWLEGPGVIAVDALIIRP